MVNARQLTPRMTDHAAMNSRHAPTSVIELLLPAAAEAVAERALL
jgi:hypothetical protein